jgi:hypothetical protein
MLYYLELSKGLWTLVDFDDFIYFSKWKWSASFGSRGTKWYAIRRGHTSEGPLYGQRIALHREIMKCPAGMVVDHLNGNSLDNRRCNLEVITQAENMFRVANWKRRVT